MKVEELYAAHLDTVLRSHERALERSAAAGRAYESVIVHAGSELYVHRDDQPYPFRPHFHFTRLLPLPGPDHLVEIRPGCRPRVLRVVPRDYWYEAPAPSPVPLQRLVDLEEVESLDDALDALGVRAGRAFVGDDIDLAAELGVDEDDVEPEALMASLDYDRATKTAFEIECIRDAARRAAVAHAAVREGVDARTSERALHFDYLAAAGLVEDEVPYPNIIGWDAHAAVLHYTSRTVTAPDPGGLLLIDAGASSLGYACDITRTYLTDAAPDELRALLQGMDRLQRTLVEAVAPGVDYVELHAHAHRLIAELLVEQRLLRVGVEEALEAGLTWPFFPHGLGHHLGLQVHDVGGRQIDPSGTLREPPEAYPHLRTTRPLDVGHVVTIEPGLYFIPMLLDPVRQGPRAGAIDWDLVDRLVPYGGIRIEDDVWVRESGAEDLTAEVVPH